MFLNLLHELFLLILNYHLIVRLAQITINLKLFKKNVIFILLIKLFLVKYTFM